jgi:peroxiredoxin family protein
MPEKKERPKFVIFAHSGTYDRLYQMGTIAATAAAMGNDVILILFFKALEKFVKGDMEQPDLSEDFKEDGAFVFERIKKANPNSIEEMLQMVRELGKLKIYACTANVSFMGLAEEEVLKKVDEVLGLPTILKLTSDARTKIYL